MIILKIKDKEKLKAKAKEKNTLAVCSLCPSWNFTKEEIEEIGKDLNAKTVKVPVICNMPEINLNPEGTIFVLACGAGVQAVGEIIGKEVVPVADTIGIGIKKQQKILNYCSACGNCMVDETVDICAKTRCKKGVLNGPCAGVHDGLCELSTNENKIPCAWIEICNKMINTGMKDKLLEIRML